MIPNIQMKQPPDINIYSDDENDYLISPVFDLSGSTYYLSFDLGMTDYGDTDAGTLADDR